MLVCINLFLYFILLYYFDVGVLKYMCSTNAKFCCLRLLNLISKKYQMSHFIIVTEISLVKEKLKVLLKLKNYYNRL